MSATLSFVVPDPSGAERDFVVRMFSAGGEPLGDWDVWEASAQIAAESTAGEMLAGYGAEVFPLILVVGSAAWRATVTVENAGHTVECSLDYREIRWCECCEEVGHVVSCCPSVVEMHPDGASDGAL